MHDVRYELLTLGDELLLGLTPNTHLTFIGLQLGRRGALLRRNVTVTDEADAIAAEFRASWARADVVITTGGLGPTCDDRTRDAIAEVLGQKLVFDPAVEKEIEARFARLGRKMTPNNLKQAYVFERGEVLPNPNGTAPGLWVEQDGRILVMLPGPPNELHPMFLEQVVPRLAARGRLLESEAFVQLRTAGVGESALETKLQPIFDRYGSRLSIAYCAHLGAVDCRVSAANGELSRAELEAIAGECATLLGDDFVCFGHDSLARVCAELLRQQEKKVAVVETATGGLLANAFSETCGACKFFAAGVICCSNDAKMQLLDVPECLLFQHGAVSDEAAVAMATGAAETLGADYALAITGFASATTGEEGGTLGTVYLALFSPSGVWSKKLNYPGPRPTMKARVVNAALDWLRRELLRAQRGAIIPPLPLRAR
ncbi:CinA family nicotinamide mononucleotide deamidase-related protein [Opitutus sp. ER46]|uniref:CinA family nicotinamide mononucleotide deamidase-related protein n=1 Tax=Opitutus sp. ER46 TaxID=2161864 RepID=UPI001E5782C4|nr:CinA family nicotinamide mononucleotide deamidase-related protein [Opitutus sp. ER46]